LTALMCLHPTPDCVVDAEAFVTTCSAMITTCLQGKTDAECAAAAAMANVSEIMAASAAIDEAVQSLPDGSPAFVADWLNGMTGVLDASEALGYVATCAELEAAVNSMCAVMPAAMPAMFSGMALLAVLGMFACCCCGLVFICSCFFGFSICSWICCCCYRRPRVVIVTPSGGAPPVSGVPVGAKSSLVMT